MTVKTNNRMSAASRPFSVLQPIGLGAKWLRRRLRPRRRSTALWLRVLRLELATHSGLRSCGG